MPVVNVPPTSWSSIWSLEARSALRVISPAPCDEASILARPLLIEICRSALGRLATSNTAEIDHIYDAIAAQARNTFAKGVVEVDSHLVDRASDMREGLTLIARLDPMTISRFAAILEELVAVEPTQHRYDPAEFHLTVLTLITASSRFAARHHEIPNFSTIVGRIVRESAPFKVRFSGLVMAPNGVLVKGYPLDDKLQRLRDSLRAAIHAAGLGDQLDSRYTIKTAHCTILRFTTQLNNLDRFQRKIAALATIPLGALRIDTVQLVTNDWYMSRDRTALVAAYALGDCVV